MRPPSSRAAALAPLAAGLLAAGCGTGAALQTSAPRQPDSSAVIWACGQQAVVAPRSLVVACADGNTSLADLRWSDWGAETATARGRLVANLCDPDCAAGRYTSWPVNVSVSDLVIGDHHAAYAAIRMVATGRHPRGSVRVLATSLFTDGPGGRS